jgi:hypothetical protein
MHCWSKEMTIRTRPPIAVDEFHDLVSKIKNGNSRHIDGKILSCLIELAFHCALKKKELINLRIGDVVDNDGQIRDGIERTKGRVHLSDNAKRVIQETLVHLAKVESYRTDLDSPLFPDKDGGKYSNRKLSRHIERYVGKHSESTLEKIRQAGICRFYESLKAQLTADQKLKATEEFADLFEKQVLGIIEGKIQPAGRPKTLEHEDLLDWLRNKRNLSENELWDVVLQAEAYDSTESDSLTAFQETFFRAVDGNSNLSEDTKSQLKKNFIQSLPGA